MAVRLSAAILLLLVILAAASAHVCRHDLFAPGADTLVTGVRLRGKQEEDGGRVVKRQVTRNQPIRVSVQYDSSFRNQPNTGKMAIIENDVIPRLVDFLSAALSVPRTTAPITLNRRCNTIEAPLSFPGDENRYCADQCANTTVTCGVAAVPDEHLSACRQCLGAQTQAQCQTIGTDGAGVAATDYILYVSADDSRCPGGFGNAQILAFALACQLEALLDRPTAGNIHFCPSGLTGRSTEYIYRVTTHEVLHALGFSSSLFPFWREEDGTPRTPRTSSGLPPIVNNMFQVSNSTLLQVNYSDWQTRAPNPIIHTVTHLVTPRVVAEARAHYGCPTLPGVEMENQGGPATTISHWEKRIFGNEAMTGQLTLNPVFSRMTLALLEDTGWYSVDYSLAEELVWGRGAGCRFALGSCAEWIQTQTNAGQTIEPFCNFLLTNENIRLGCTFDRESFSVCTLKELPSSELPLDEDYLYFNSGPNFGSDIASRVGSLVILTDYCAFQDEITVDSRGGVCADVNNAPPSMNDNLRLEAFGTGSRCVEHGRQWTANGVRATYGGGCYQFECTSSGVVITVAGQQFSCECEGQEFLLDITSNNTQFLGSIVCPSCAQICHDQLDVCPSPEAAACFDRVEDAIPTVVPTATDPTSTTTAGGSAVLPTLGALLTLLSTLLISALTVV